MNDRFIKKLWHTNRKIFLKEFSILQTINSDGNVEHTYFEYNHKTQNLERLSSCQIKEIDCTGLKDKNGKLIFEGDVAKALSKPDREGCFSEWLGVTVYNTENCQFQFKVEKYKFMGEGSLNTYPCHHYIDFIEIDNIEIVGNIYENEDLLKCENQ